MSIYLDHSVLRSFDCVEFQRKKPFPWANVSGVLTCDGFAELTATYPSLDLFEKHVGVPRVHGQRPHNRYYLAFDKSIYAARLSEGRVVGKQQLSSAWQNFIAELNGADYRSFIQSTLGIDNFVLRMAWHVGEAGSEVSPHVDAAEKIATHIFYFNTSNDWQDDWGGSTLVLSGKTSAVLNPDFCDFAEAVSCTITNNHSFLFANTKDAWHGVRELKCPVDRHRRLFNVVVEKPGSRGGLARRLWPFGSLFGGKPQ
jgi:hypothetical protein